MPVRLRYIIDAFHNLGGAARLNDLYVEVQRIHDKIHNKEHKRLGGAWKANVRARIYEYSSDSNIFNGWREDLFQNIARGRWALRAQTWDGKILDGAEPFIAEEGRRLLRIHMHIERSSRLIREFKESLGVNLRCSICDFDFEEKYGDFGAGYIEAHHIVPIASANHNKEASIKDLIGVCANCHRVLHRNPLEDSTLRQIRRKIRSHGRYGR